MHSILEMKCCEQFPFVGCNLTDNLSKQYEPFEKIGEGTFGEVRRAFDRFNGKMVAIKYLPISNATSNSFSKNLGGLPISVFRELQALKQLSGGRGIVKLLNAYAEESSLCLVMELLVTDLSAVIDSAKQYFPRNRIKCYFQMILEAVSFCHSRSIIHRDIKPSNFLLASNGALKLADFGLARAISRESESNDMTHQVATRWYRAPELLFASRSYSFPSDIWSVAVVFAEILALRPLFPGSNDIDQMYRVFQVMGSPTPSVWPGVELLPDYCKVNFPDMVTLDMRTMLPGAHKDDVCFVQSMLRLPPKDRCSAREALTSRYFLLPPQPCPISSALLSCGNLIVGMNKDAEKSQSDKIIKTVEEFKTAMVDPIMAIKELGLAEE